MRKRTMNAELNKPIKIVLSRSLCKLVNGGVGTSKNDGPRVEKADKSSGS